jgi:predicted Zn-dependent peptidase
LAWTDYSISIPADSFPEVSKAFLQHITTPLIKDEDIRHEASIIGNERRRKSKWYPGDSKLEYHCRMKWKEAQLVTLRQCLGEDADLSEINKGVLEILHQAYFDPRAHLFVGGTFDSDHIAEMLSQIQTVPHALPEQYHQVKWKNRDYHEAKCSDGQRYIYHLGGIIDSRDPQVIAGITFLGTMLMQPTPGTLYDWLRHDLGWVYETGFTTFHNSPPDTSHWELWVPLTDQKQASHVRSELHSRILQALTDKRLIESELRRRLARRVFMNQTLESVLDDGETLLHNFGRIIPEKEFRDILQRCADPLFLQDIYERYWSPVVSGEFLALPENA